MKLTDNLNIRKSIAIMVLAATFAACSGDSTDTPANGYNDGPTNPSGEAEEIRVNADVFQMMDGTRATTYDNDAAIQTEGSFICTAYDAGKTTINTASKVNGITATWNGSTAWEFAEKHYWPLTDALDFFAYMPATKPDYITSIDYPSFVCTDLSSSATKEFIFALKKNQNRNTNSGTVSLNFKHPFAKLIFKLSAWHPNITIKTITFKSLKTGGTCTFDGSTITWDPLTPAGTVDFVATINTDYNSNPASPRQVGDSYLVVPQEFSGDIEVNAVWTDWGEVEARTVSTSLTPHTWQPGYSYTYIFTLSQYHLTVNIEKYTEQW